MKIKVYLDSDTIIAALIKPDGATAELLKSSKITKHLSNTSQTEILRVSRRMALNVDQTQKIIKSCQLTTVTVKEITQVSDYVYDLDDQHILASAKKSQSQFLVTYNLKHYNISRIHRELGIIVLIPAKLLQHVRGL